MDENISISNISSIFKADYADDQLAVIDDFSTISIDSDSRYISDAALLVFVRSGYVYIDIDRSAFRVTSSHLLLVRPGHAISHPTFSSDFVGHAVALSMRFAQQLMAVVGNIWGYLERLDTEPAMALPQASTELLHSYYNLLKLEADHRDNAFRGEVISSIARAMLCTLINDVRRYVPLTDVSGADSPHAMDLFNRFMRLLNDERPIERKISYYADRLCVTPKYLSIVCKKVSNRTAHQWICNSIVNGIDNCLRYTNMSPKEISVLYGFPNLSFFSRYVKKHLGYSPTFFSRRNS